MSRVYGPDLMMAVCERAAESRRSNFIQTWDIVSKVPFFMGLVFIVLGTGLLKPNVSAVVGHLYSADDPRRDGSSHVGQGGTQLEELVEGLEALVEPVVVLLVDVE